MNTTTTTIISLLTNRKLLQSADLDTCNSISPPSTVTKPPYNNPTVPFDSSMAITIIALLTALFFMALFSFYIRRHFTTDDNTLPHQPSKTRNCGLDTSLINSLPLVAYGRTTGKQGVIVIIDECPICLQEFEVSECVKMIPYCGHLFHPTCLDRWLSLHVTCPICRSSQLFKEKEVGMINVGDGGTWRGVGSSGVQRSHSWSNLRGDHVLPRTMSF